MIPNEKIDYDNNCGNPSSILGLDTMLRKASEARVDTEGCDATT